MSLTYSEWKHKEFHEDVSWDNEADFLLTKKGDLIKIYSNGGVYDFNETTSPFFAKYHNYLEEQITAQKIKTQLETIKQALREVLNERKTS